MSSRQPATLRIELIRSALESLSIPDGVYQKAIARYDAVTRFLEEPNTRIFNWKPDMYIQGSIAMGLAIRPPGRSDFDFDVTCELQPEHWRTAMAVREEVAVRLREDSNYSRMLNTTKNRCLCLDYAQAEQFHMDIVVARVARWVSETATGIEVTDRAIAHWIGTDPKGFIAWFAVRRDLVMAHLMEKDASFGITANAAPVPDQPEDHEKKPLQWVIQIMKRHRDLTFISKAIEDAPISVVLTTLAAKAYRGEQDIDSALEGITNRLLDQFDDPERWTVLNPCIPTENFAEKWATKPHRRKAFFDWFDQFQRDVEAYLEATKVVSIANGLECLVGKNPKIAAFNAHAEILNEKQRTGSLAVVSRAATIVPAIVPGSKVIPRHNNFGTL